MTLTQANKMHQSSHPTLLTIHIRVANRSVTNIMLRIVIRRVVAKRPAEAFLSPKGGGVWGCETIIKLAKCRRKTSREYVMFRNEKQYR